MTLNWRPLKQGIPYMVTLRVKGACRFLTGLLGSWVLSLPLPCPSVPMWLTKPLVIWFEFINVGLTPEAQSTSVQFSRSVVSDSVTPWTATHQASLSITNLPEFTQTHVHWVSDAIQPSHCLLSPSPPAFNPSQHQGLFQWVSSSRFTQTLRKACASGLVSLCLLSALTSLWFLEACQVL